MKYDPPRERTIEELARVQHARMHLEKGYPEIWSLIKQAQEESSSICDEIQGIIKQFEDIILKAVSEGSELPRIDACECK